MFSITTWPVQETRRHWLPTRQEPSLGFRFPYSHLLWRTSLPAQFRIPHVLCKPAPKDLGLTGTGVLGSTRNVGLQTGDAL
jgi:hypothetical protein